MTNRQVILFMSQVLVLFLLCLLASYYSSPYWLPILAAWVEAVLQWAIPSIIESITVHGRSFEVITVIPAQSDPNGVLAFDINPLKYTYGLPLFLALIFSSPSRWNDKFLAIITAYFITTLGQVWGLGFDIIRTLIFEFNGYYAHFLGISELGRNLVTLAAQFGFLLMPSLLPVLLWLSLETQFIRQLLKPPVSS